MYCVDVNKLYFNAYPDVRKVICKETAASIQGLISNYGIPLYFYYQNGDIINSSYIRGIRNLQMNNLLIKNQSGLEITSPEQTIYDLLNDFDNVSLEFIHQSLCNYYFKHGKTFDNLLIVLDGGAVKKRFDSEYNEALTFYDD